MNILAKLALFLLSASFVALPVAAEQSDNNKMEPQQHGTTQMHTSPSEEDDMSHTMHESPASKAATNKVPPSDGEQYADHDMAEHSQHGKPMTKSGTSVSKPLEKLKQLPSSGKSREANYDGTYFMHNTSLEQSLEARCALASRGLMMLDNEDWKKCGGKPIGWSKGITSAQSDDEHSQHMNH